MDVREAAVADYDVALEPITADDVPPGYKRTEVGVIPEDWRLVCFGDAVESYIDYRGRTPRKLGMEWGGGEILALSANNVQMGRVAPEKEAYFGSDDLYKKWMLQGDCEQGDVLLTTEAPLGNVAQVPDSKKYILSQRVLLIKPKHCLLRDYLFHLMTGEQFQAQLHLNASGTTATGIQRARLDVVPISIPDRRAEQQDIAEALSDADALIESLQQLIAKKRALKQGAMQALLTGRQRLPGFTGEWRPLSMSEKSSLKARIGWQGLTTAEYLRIGDFYLVTGTDFADGKILWPRCCFVARERYAQDRNIQLRAHDILLTKDGTIGKAAYVEDLPGPATLNSGVFVIRPLEGSYDPKFFYYVLMSGIFGDFLTKLQAGSTISHLYQKDFTDFSFLAPAGVEEQIAIAAVLSDMDAEIEALEARLAKTRALKAGMMQQLLTGRIRLPFEQAV